MPHVVIDNHEFFFSEMGNYENDPERYLLNDFQITGATSLNDDPAVTDLTVNLVVDKMHKDLLDTGFRAYHYGITSNNPIGRAYYGLGNAISVLIESHGADGALFAMPRRVYGQVVATKSVFETTAANGKTIMDTVNNARADVVEKGKTYNEDDVLVLKQSASGKATSPTALPEYVADIYGNIEEIGRDKIDLQDTIVRSRTRPTAYVVDASEPWVEELTYILDHHNAEYYTVPAGSAIDVQQYYYIKDDGAKSCIADLRESERITFSDGALVVPMDQESGNIIGMLMEPDVGDSSSYNGTLYQYRLIDYDPDTKDFPLYRYTGNNPRNVIADNSGTSGGGGGGSSSYSISVDKNIENGTVTVSPKSASSGRTVTITVKPDEGYELDELTVTDKNGDEIELTDKGDGRYTFKMPRSKVTIEASFVEIDHQDTCPAAGFRDVDEDAWYHEAVDYALDNGLMSGVSDREFAPGSTLTRAMVAQMLYSLEGKPAAGRADFADVAEGAWYADAISWAAGEGIVSGYGDTFGPNDPITREQLAAILYRYAQNEGYKTSQSGKGTEGYLDASSISSYAVKAMDWAVNAGLLSGKGNNTLAPTAGATRAEVAQIFMNFCENIAK